MPSSLSTISMLVCECSRSVLFRGMRFIRGGQSLSNLCSSTNLELPLKQRKCEENLLAGGICLRSKNV